MGRTRVAVLYGGPSSEHEVSILSAQNILEHIDKELFSVVEILISKEGLLRIGDEFLETEEAIKKIKDLCDIVYPVLHGTFGEDGKLQKMLEDENIPFVGSGSESSRIAIDKSKANELFESFGLSVPGSQIVSSENFDIRISFPIIIKPVSEGSSVGLYKCNDTKEYDDVKGEIFSKYPEMLAQEFVTGRELTCGVLEIDGKPVALPLSEIILNKSGIFDYKTKYTSGECTEVTPADLEPEIAKRIQTISLRCHEILGCKNISRTDVILSEKGTIFVLETNTLPGMTKTSFIPQQALAHGLSMKSLVSILLK